LALRIPSQLLLIGVKSSCVRAASGQVSAHFTASALDVAGEIASDVFPTICTDELGPVVPRTFPPAPGWSPNGHRIKAEMDYGRGPEKTWVYGALRVRDGKELTRCAASRNSKGYIALLADIEADNPNGDIFIISDNLSSHNSLETRTWLEGHPRLHHVFIPTGACWLNLQEGWWRLFRRDALAGQSFANPDEIEQATRVATRQLNRRAKPWVWGRPPKDHRQYRRLFCYRI